MESPSCEHVAYDLSFLCKEVVAVFTPEMLLERAVFKMKAVPRMCLSLCWLSLLMFINVDMQALISFLIAIAPLFRHQHAHHQPQGCHRPAAVEDSAPQPGHIKQCSADAPTKASAKHSLRPVTCGLSNGSSKLHVRLLTFSNLTFV